MTIAMASRSSAEQLTLLRKLAAREAARRQQAQQSQTTDSAAHPEGIRAGSEQPEHDGTDLPRRSRTEQSVKDYSFLRQDASLIEARTLSTLLRDEQARNDVDLKRVNDRLARLSNRSPEEEDTASRAGPSRSRSRSQQRESESLKRKKLTLRRLEYELQQADAELDTLEDAQSDEILALLTRATVASAVEQYDEGLHMLRRDLSAEQALLREDEELYSRLQQVQAGLERKRVVVERRAQERVDAKAIQRKLEGNLREAEEDLSHFLRSLIEISDSIFSESDSVQRAQLRHLIDTLINRAWDTPADPYIDASSDYHASIVAFVLRANIAAEHPRDARRIRLIDFAARPQW